MTVGEIFLESLSTGVITEQEVNWLASHQASFDRPEEAAAIRPSSGWRRRVQMNTVVIRRRATRGFRQRSMAA